MMGDDNGTVAYAPLLLYLLEHILQHMTRLAVVSTVFFSSEFRILHQLL